MANVEKWSPKTFFTAVSALAGAGATLIAYLAYQARHEGPDIVIVNQPPAVIAGFGRGLPPDKDRRPPAIDKGLVQSSLPGTGYFGPVASGNYLALSAEPSIASSIRAALDLGSMLEETSPRFLDDGYFLKALSGDPHWRSEVEVPVQAQKLYLIEVGPMVHNKGLRGNARKSASRRLQIVVVDLAKSGVIWSKKIALTASQFTEPMLDADFEQQIGEMLRQNLSEVVKHEQT